MLEIQKPTLIVNKQICRGNIAKMVAKAAHHKIELKPHFKTHQSHAIGEWYREAGISSITVSSVGMAQYFAGAGWKDITIAFPCNISQLDLINKLGNDVTLTLLISNDQIIDQLSQQLSTSVKVYVEIEEGGGRTGFQVEDVNAIKQQIHKIEESEFLEFVGIYCHAGQTYSKRGANKVKEFSSEVLSKLLNLKKLLLVSWPETQLCFGDTPSCSILESFDGIDVISAGNFVFYDVMQTEIGSCAFTEIAVALACPIVSIDTKKQELCIYGGAIHLSKDHAQSSAFGQVAREVEGKWEIIENVVVNRVSQEHGMVKIPNFLMDDFEIGEVLYVLPIHSCLTAQCIGEYHLADGTSLDHYAQKKRA